MRYICIVYDREDLLGSTIYKKVRMYWFRLKCASFWRYSLIESDQMSCTFFSLSRCCSLALIRERVYSNFWTRNSTICSKTQVISCNYPPTSCVRRNKGLSLENWPSLTSFSMKFASFASFYSEIYANSWLLHHGNALRRHIKQANIQKEWKIGLVKSWM